jgi:hypothetical protein
MLASEHILIDIRLRLSYGGLISLFNCSLPAGRYAFSFLSLISDSPNVRARQQ